MSVREQIAEYQRRPIRSSLINAQVLLSGELVLRFPRAGGVNREMRQAFGARWDRKWRGYIVSLSHADELRRRLPELESQIMREQMQRVA